MTEIVAQLERLGVDAFDVSFASTLARLTGCKDYWALLGAALACHAAREGHVCLDLSRPSAVLGMDNGGLLPDADSWVRSLRAAPFVRETKEGATPLVLEGNRLYLDRYYLEECFLADEVLARIPAKGIEGRLPEDAVERAVAIALQSALVLVCGGPNTGKTEAAVQILVALARAGFDPSRFALLAPTTMAASRFTESVRKALTNTSEPLDLLERFPRDCFTIHRALDTRPYRPYDPVCLQECTAVIVDEAQLMDLVTASRLFRATPRKSPIVLLGDLHQIASVGVGTVFSDLCDALPEVRADLDQVWHNEKTIAALAEAVVLGDEEAVLDIFARQNEAVVAVDPAHGWLEKMRAVTTENLKSFVAAVRAQDANNALEAARRFRILCAVRRGPFGSESLNAKVISWLWNRAPGGWFPGRLVSLTQDDSERGLINGDVGVSIATSEGLRVFFEGDEPGSMRSFASVRLMPHEDAFALTIHRSLGYHFDYVALVLPPDYVPILTRELLYSGITRAYKGLTLVARPEVLVQAVRNRTHRTSGLCERLKLETGGRH